MNHKFLPSQLDKLRCCYQFQEFSIKCNRDLMAHTKLATCESCNAIAECEIYADNILMCWNCKDKNIQVLIDKTEASAIQARAINQTVFEIEKIGMDGLQFSGDFFNLKLQTFAEMSQAIQRDDNIPLVCNKGNELCCKQHVYNKMVSARIKDINLRVNIHDEEKRQLLVERLAAANALRDFGNMQRDEIRKLMVESDANYQPIINADAIAKSIRKNVVKSPFERAAEALAIASNMTLEQAREKILKGIKK